MARYAGLRLVRYEVFDDLPSAIAREKRLQRWLRQWKTNLIEEQNPAWNDLASLLGIADGLPDAPSSP